MAKENSTTDSASTETIIEEVEVKRTKKAAAEKRSEAYRVTVPLLNIREKASMAAEIIGTLMEADIVNISTRTPQGFGKLADDDGYIKLEFAEKMADE